MDFFKMLGFIFEDFFGFTLPILLRKLVTFIDGLIYTADAELYDLIVKIARQEIFGKGTLNEVAGRVYQLLALIMVFRLIFLFVTYIVNPDDMLDKTKGYQNVLKKMIITLGLIIVTPWGFQQARIVQQLILEEGIIEYFVFGQGNTANVSSGYEFMHTVGILFVTPYMCTDDCKTVAGQRGVNNADDKLCEHGRWDANISVNTVSGNISCASGAGSTCTAFCGLGTGDTEFQTDSNYGSTLFKAAYPTGDKYDLRALMALGGEGNWETHTFYAKYEYPFIGTTLVGIFIGYMLIVMCIDIALRSVKLSFYELIAPIPIVSYIGPKDGKETMLNKWFSQVLKTYADLFTRIAGLEIAVFFINTLLKDENLIKSREFFVELFLILGALTFAKKLPDILKDLGVKFETGNFNLKKKLGDDLAGRRAINAGLGAVGGMAANAIHKAANIGNRWRDRETRKNLRNEAFNNAIANGQNLAQARWAAHQADRQFKRDNASQYGGSMLAGAVRGAVNGAKNDKGGLTPGAIVGAVKSGAHDAVVGRQERDRAMEAGATGLGRVAAGFEQSLGIETTRQKMDRVMEARDNIKKGQDALAGQLDKVALKNNVSVAGSDLGGGLRAAAGVGYNSILSQMNIARSKGLDHIDVAAVDATGHATTRRVDITEFEGITKKMQEHAYNNILAGTATTTTGDAVERDAEADAMFEGLQRTITHSSDRVVRDAYDPTKGGFTRISDASKAGQVQSSIDRNSEGYRRATANEMNAKKSGDGGKK